MRSAAIGPTLRLPTDPGPLRLRVLPEALVAAGSYRIVFEQLADDGATARSITVDGSRAAADGFVDLYLDSRTLQPGRYRVSIRPAGAAASRADRFDLKIVAADTAL